MKLFFSLTKGVRRLLPHQYWHEASVLVSDRKVTLFSAISACLIAFFAFLPATKHGKSDKSAFLFHRIVAIIALFVPLLWYLACCFHNWLQNYETIGEWIGKSEKNYYR
jgi:hypothetical protein